MKGRVLAVDDEQSIRVALEMSFEDEGWECVTASSGEDGLRVLRAESFDVLIFDKNMPGGMGGLELLAKVREENRDVPVVIMTAFASAGSAKESLNLGVDRYVEKPFADVFELTRIASELVALGRRRWIPDENVFDVTFSSKLPTGESRPLRVVIAARDTSVHDELSRRLLPLGAKIARAESEEEAAGTAASEPDLIVVDADAWAGEGLALLERVRKRAPDASLVLLSAQDPSLAAMKKMIEIGIAGLLPRRFDDTLTKRLAEIVRTVRER